jgi:long-chain fatty acid transport protein
MSPRSCQPRGAAAALALVAVALLVVGLSHERGARAGGLTMAGHGVRGLARGGAFTAGGDDPGGIWYNPAAVAASDGLQVLLDGAIVLYRMDYTRVDSGGNLLPTVKNDGPIVPIPTLAASRRLWRKLYVGGSFSAPFAPLPRYPRPNYGACDASSPSHCIDSVTTDAPQRYSLISLVGTLFLQLDLAFAYEIIPQLVVAVSLQNLFANFVTMTSVTSYNGFSSGPEDPEFDCLGQMKMTDLFNPSAKFGVLVKPHPMIRLGASLQLPYWVGGDASVNVQLPATPLFAKSTVEGNQADIRLTFPLTLRIGAEIRPIPELRIEVGFDWEKWSMLDAIRIRPKNIYINNLPGIDRYLVSEIDIVLGFRDSFAARVGGEYSFSRVPLVLRAGYFYERGAVEDAYASVLAADPNKHVVTLGAGYTLFGFRIDVVYAHFFVMTRVVDYRQSLSLQINPINPTGSVGVGAGRYAGGTDVIGLGVEKGF